MTEPRCPLCGGDKGGHVIYHAGPSRAETQTLRLDIEQALIAIGSIALRGVPSNTGYLFRADKVREVLKSLVRASSGEAMPIPVMTVSKGAPPAASGPSWGEAAPASINLGIIVSLANGIVGCLTALKLPSVYSVELTGPDILIRVQIDEKK